MIRCTGDCRTGPCRILLQPNRPLSWRGSQLAWLLISLPALLLALVLTAMGFWPILPFAGLELGLLYLAFYLSSRRQYCQEHLNLTRKDVIVTRLSGGRRTRIRLPRAWTRLSLLKGPGSWHPPRISLLYCGRMTEIGAELDEAERQQLLDTLQAAGIAREPRHMA
ncbi:MAG: DUF2244 domain-containing protein [Xanthomonadaceae bacterium]|nr:DUF2244 domain-containing protein [Xanthomonadaceae bacterium]